MFPFNDLIMSLLETPFSRRSENNKRQILNDGRPIVLLYNLNIKNSNSKVCSRSFKESWYDSHKWLCGSFYEQRLYCWLCVLLSKVKNVWFSDGYFDLKNLSRSVKKMKLQKTI
jgi:hypothetical protein